MEVIILPDAERAARLAARLIADALRAKPDLVLGLATGRTMEQVYDELARQHREAGLDFARCRTFNLDEYVGLASSHPQSYHATMDRTLFVEGGFDNNRTHLPNGTAPDLPYHNIGHIRNCLAELGPKQTKTVDRVPQREILYRCVQGGFYVGDQQGTVYYPYPSLDELEGKYHAWWRSANDVASVD